LSLDDFPSGIASVERDEAHEAAPAAAGTKKMGEVAEHF